MTRASLCPIMRKKIAKALKQVFGESLESWGGWPGIVYASPALWLEPITSTVRNIEDHCKTLKSQRPEMSEEGWTKVSTLLPTFFNAYLQQELSRITDGPGDIHMALMEVESPSAAALLLAMVIVAREHRLGVEVNFTWSDQSYSGTAKMGYPGVHSILSIGLAREYGEERLPFLLHYFGEEFVWDKDSSTKENPVWKAIRVDEKVVIFTDRKPHAKTLNDAVSEKFLRQQGFQVLSLTPEEITSDPFARAADAIRMVTGKSLPKSGELD
jgi:hypothetical protein